MCANGCALLVTTAWDQFKCTVFTGCTCMCAFTLAMCTCLPATDPCTGPAGAQAPHACAASHALVVACGGSLVVDRRANRFGQLMHQVHDPITSVRAERIPE
ncbi:hypothetical protein AMTR_s00008p00262930 [Amborella trichopoda]|uniref:Uncharacterized protein n=1 Tax=Amborella trichopoda TaxID=13333 RepID=W1NJ24_AMBTC|nr:hypothetical protein AMTR_s00008p00262930 [Amborella trichopoda]